MSIDYLFLEIILKIITYSILVFGLFTIIVQFTSGRLISELEIRLHYFTNHNGKRILHVPPLGSPKVWEVFDVITALWILFRARSWAKKSKGGQMIIAPKDPTPFLSALFPSKVQMYQRLRIYLQSKVQQPGSWVRRASSAISNPNDEGDEVEYQFFVSLEYSNPEAKAIYIHVLAVDTIDEIVESNGAFSETLHSHWPFTEERIQILKEGCEYLQEIRERPKDENNLVIWL